MADKNTEKRAPRRKPEKKGAAAHTVTSMKLELLITIVDRKKAEYYADLIQSLEVNMQVTAFGHGTADAKMLVYLGLAESDKAVIFSIIRQDKIKDAINMLDEKFRTIKDGKGVAFTVPFTSVIGSLIFRFLSNAKMTGKEEK